MKRFSRFLSLLLTLFLLCLAAEGMARVSLADQVRNLVPSLAEATSACEEGLPSLRRAARDLAEAGGDRDSVLIFASEAERFERRADAVLHKAERLVEMMEVFEETSRWTPLRK